MLIVEIQEYDGHKNENASRHAPATTAGHDSKIATGVEAVANSHT